MIFSARPQPVSSNRTRLQADRSPDLDFSAQRLATTLEHEAERLDPDGAMDRAELVNCIRRRIETRLPGRIRSLHIFVTDHAVVLAGECNTYYTKQLAQHAAMGVLEYERLVNNIDVHS